ncbi:MAG: UDP-N-acetylglucosamine 2-epimerase (non-hydrolyzing) [Nitrosopumilus sp.]|nr:UDP-N-acetylglucosamine 2-epimerase (non-hydrolyzing) [Nitrosopumilus sp.]MDH3385414.1 UDP-N-acetylglucosamine 2-epimerase (non-hydrolyzing) [Nitrosopumilus sp.]
MKDIAIVIGTRPEIIKMAPIIQLAKKKNTTVIFSGQHYDYDLGIKFFDELHLPRPDVKIKLSKNPPAHQMGEIIQKLSKILIKSKPEIVLVHGDTNTTLASTIASIKSEIPVGHVESGIRSFDWRMPEEHNRLATDHLAELLFTPTDLTKKNLVKDNVHGKIFVTGNTSIDSIRIFEKLAENRLNLDNYPENFVLATFHRMENVDNKTILTNIVKALIESKLDIIFPIHPRTRKRLKEFGLENRLLKNPKIKTFGPLGYLDLIFLMKKCSFIITDSGGIQEEATAPKIRKKVIVVRKTTDRPESISMRFADMVGFDSKSIVRALQKISRNPNLPKGNSPFGNGYTSQKILKIINNH